MATDQRPKEDQPTVGPNGEHDKLSDMSAAESAQADQLLAQAADPNQGGVVEQVQEKDPAQVPAGPGIIKDNRKSFLSRNRKWFIGSGIAGGLVAVAIGGFLALLPLKLIHIRENLVQHFDSRLQYAMQQRAGKLYYAKFDSESDFAHYSRFSGNPIFNAIHNARLDKITSDLKARGIRTKFSGTRVTGFENINTGKSIEFTKNGLARGFVRDELTNLYPEKGWIRRGLLAHRLYAAYGISLRPLGNFSNKYKDWKLKIRDSIRNRLFGSTVGGGVNSKGTKPTKDNGVTPAEAKAADSFGSDIKTQADKVRTDSLANAALKEAPPLESVLKSGAAGAVKGAIQGALLGSLNTLNKVCGVINLIHAIAIGAEVLRAAPMARFAGLLLTSADQAKANQIPSDELNAVMNTLSDSSGDVTQSGGWQRLVAGNTSASITTGDRFRVDSKFSGTLQTVYAQASTFIGPSTCRVVGNFFVQVGGFIATAFEDFFSSGSDVALNAAQGAAVGAFRSAALRIIEPIAINEAAGMTVTGDESPIENGDALVAGYDIISNNNERLSGGQRLTPAQAASLDSTVARANTTESHSLAYRLFSQDNQHSVLSQAILKMPTSMATIFGGFGHFVASINPLNWKPKLAWAGGLAHQIVHPALASDPQEDPFGVEQFGFPSTSDLQNVDPLENEYSIRSNPDKLNAYNKWVSTCLEDSNGAVIDPGVIDGVDTGCQNPDPSYMLYRLDQQAAQELEWYTNPTADVSTNNGSGDNNGSNQSDGQLLAQQILASGKVVFHGSYVQEDLQDAAAGRPGSNHLAGAQFPISSAILKLVAVLTQGGHQVSISALESAGTGHCYQGGSSPHPWPTCQDAHYTGDAIDIDGLDGIDNVNGRDAKSLVIIQTAEQVLATAGFGQAGCQGHAPLPLPSGFREFGDTCSHLHIEIPKGTP